MVSKSLPRYALVLLAAGALVLAGCGGGYGEVYYEEEFIFEPIGDVEVDNQTDLGGTFEDMFAFEMAPAGTAAWSGNLLPDILFPGEIAFVGSFYEDFYDADADLDLGIVSFFDVFVEDGFTTTFEVF
ncbi:MAG: hypothetical protein QNJ90_06015 [Planctomycetota bacterium]|nr:hypothetical protein [Planctomycetota bacterium]